MQDGIDSSDLLIRNIRQLLTMDSDLGEEAVGLLENAAVVIRDGKIAWVGAEQEVPARFAAEAGTRLLDADGAVVLPGLIDAHTHLVYAGNRAEEWAERLSGATYEEVAARGGGIMSTVRATRSATEQELRDALLQRLADVVARGVTTVEVKSGYGLQRDQELRLLRVIEAARSSAACSVVSTYLGAHTVPAERMDERELYVEEVLETLDEVASEGLATFCDVYIDEAGFSLAEGRRILERAKELGLGLKVHAEQRTHTGSAALAGAMGAVSADHLERIDGEGVSSMARGGTTAVLLPSAAMFLRDDVPSARPLIDAGIPVAVATDHNPGTSPTSDLLLAGTLACLHQGLTVDEALMGLTRNAARAVALPDRGRVSPGFRGDLAFFAVDDYRSLLYRFGHNPCCGVIVAGAHHPTP